MGWGANMAPKRQSRPASGLDCRVPLWLGSGRQVLASPDTCYVRVTCVLRSCYVRVTFVLRSCYRVHTGVTLLSAGARAGRGDG